MIYIAKVYTYIYIYVCVCICSFSDLVTDITKKETWMLLARSELVKSVFNI